MAVLITLITDFGTSDGYVGAMKGVIASRAPDAVVVDVAHQVPRHDVAHAAWVVATAAREFPSGTIHVVVVDPGVGGERAGVVVEAGGHRFVAPDNGVLAYVADEGAVGHVIATTAFRREAPSATFHGRDVFAPAAAALARGLPVAAAGPRVELTGRLPWPARVAGGRGVVVHVDAFGNLITNVPGPARAVTVAGRSPRVVVTYEQLAAGELGCYLGSAGTLEVAAREASAAALLGVARGAVVVADEPAGAGAAASRDGSSPA